MPTTRLQHPGFLVLNGEHYKLARRKNNAPYWKRSQVQVQPGRGEQVVTWESFHQGMGESTHRPEAPQCYETAATVNATQRSYLMLGPTVNAITSLSDKKWYRIMEFGGRIWVIGVTAADNDLYYMRIDPSAPGTIEGEAEVGAGLADGPPGQCAIWENNMYVGVTAADDYGWQVAPTTPWGWTAGTAAETKEAHYCRVGRDLWSVSNVAGGEAKVRKLAAGATWDSAARGAQYIVGDSGQAINSMIEWGRWLYSGKPEGIFSGDGDGNQWNQTPDLLSSSNNCLRLGSWRGAIIAPTITDLVRLTTIPEGIGPEELDNNVSSVRAGYVRAVAAAGRWLYIAYKVPSGSTYILVGRRRRGDDPPGGPMVWHGFTDIGSTYTVEDMRVIQGTTTPTLWLAMSAGLATARVVYFILAADGSPDPTSSAWRFTTGGFLYLPKVDLNSPSTTKRGHMVELEITGDTAANITVYPYANWDGGGWNALGSAIESNGRARAFWTAGSNDEGRECQVRISLASNDSTKSPEVRKVSLSLIELPRYEPAYEAVVCLYDQSDRKRTVEKQLSDLEALVSAGVYNCTDPNDPDDANIKVIVHPFEEHDLKQEGECSKHSHVRLTLRQVKYA